MSPDLLFSIVNAIAMVGWLGLILLPKVRWGGRVLSIAVAALLSVAYVALIAVALPQSEGGFSSLSGVSALFGNRWALLAGWTHYLAFDLLVRPPTEEDFAAPHEEAPRHPRRPRR